MMDSIIKVIIIDDHQIILQGMSSLLSHESDIEIVGKAMTLVDGMKLIEQNNPHVVVLDLSLENENGLELIKDCAVRFPEISILVLSMYDESIYAERVIQAGALGYLMKKDSMDKIAEGIRSVFHKKFYASETIKNQLLNQVSGIDRLGSTLPVSSLTDREFEVFVLIGKGKRPRHIAEELNMSPRTVATHCTRIRNKININSMDELIELASKWSSANPHPE